MRHYPSIQDFNGDYDSLATAQEEYDSYLSDKEDAAKEKYYEEKYK